MSLRHNAPIVCSMEEVEPSDEVGYYFVDGYDNSHYYCPHEDTVLEGRTPACSVFEMAGYPVTTGQRVGVNQEVRKFPVPSTVLQQVHRETCTVSTIIR